MQLQEVVTGGIGLDQFYLSRGINSDAERIACLTHEMGILATRCDDEETPSEILSGLEELAKLGYWRNERIYDDVAQVQQC